MSESDLAWAEAEFSSAELGDERRTSRLVEMGRRCAERGGGRVTQVFESAAEREGAFRFLENVSVVPDEVTRAAARAALGRAQEEPFVFVPVDASSLSLGDHNRTRGLGPVGSRAKCGRGLLVMNALLVAPAGTPLGLGAQRYWTRPERRRRKHRNQRSLEQKETKYWFDAIDELGRVRRQSAPATKLWFQLDRGADCREMLERAAQSEDWFTLRASWNRRLEGDGKRYLRATLRALEPVGALALQVPQSPARQEREANLVVRASSLRVRLRDRAKNAYSHVALTAVLVREEGTCPKGEKPIEWILWTNRSVHTLAEACLVVRGYATRWRVEEFHRTWKSVCRVEQTLLHSMAAIERWARLLAAVATRIERLKYLARNEPDAPASVELTPAEIGALLVRRRARKRPGCEGMPTIAQAVLWIAEMGGYTGKSSGGPPGSITIGRGLEHLTPAAEMYEIMLKM